MNYPLSDDGELTLEIENDIQRFRDCRKRAEEVIRDYGWTEEDEDFEIQIEQEAKRQWEEDIEREMEHERRWMMYTDLQE